MAYRGSASRRRREWVAALHILAVNCTESDPHESRHCIRRMNELLMIAPEEALVSGLRAIDPPRLEALLVLDAHETAAMSMLIEDVGYMLSRGHDGSSVATVVPKLTGEETSGVGATPALALIAALALSLCDAPCPANLATRPARTPARSALH